MEALKAIKIIEKQNDGRTVFYFFQIGQIPGNKGF